MRTLYLLLIGILFRLLKLTSPYLANISFTGLQLARKGQHAVRDNYVKSGTHKSIVEYEQLESELRDERAQQAELDCLNYLAQKNLIELSKKVPTEADVSTRKRK